LTITLKAAGQAAGR